MCWAKRLTDDDAPKNSPPAIGGSTLPAKERVTVTLVGADGSKEVDAEQVLKNLIGQQSKLFAFLQQAKTDSMPPEILGPQQATLDAIAKAIAECRRTRDKAQESQLEADPFLKIMELRGGIAKKQKSMGDIDSEIEKA